MGILCAALAWIAVDAGGPLGPGRHTVELTVAGHDRPYTLHVPRGLDPDAPAPAVLVLHGAGGSGEGYLDRNGWAAKAEREGFVAIAPDGLPTRTDQAASFRLNPRVWNSGQLRPLSPRRRIDDVVYLEAVLDDAARRVRIDPRRVYATGHSNGSAMTFLLASRAAGRLAAIAPVASHCFVADPKPSRGVPTLYIVGTKDPLAPIEGGLVKMPWGPDQPRPPIRESLATWARGLGAPSEPVEVRDEPGLKIEEYGPGRDGATLTAIYIEGHGHGWPGGREAGLPESLVGPTRDTLNATDAIWDFFRQHPRPEADRPVKADAPPASRP